MSIQSTRGRRRPPVSLSLFRFSTRIPDELGEALEPVAPGVSAAAGRGLGFLAEVQEAALPGMGLFRARLEDAQVVRVPRDYVAVTLPLAGEMLLGRGRSSEIFNSTKAHLLWPDDELDLEVSRGAELLVCTFPEERFARAADGGRGTTWRELRSRSRDLDLRTQEGQAFLRYLSFVWTEVRRGAEYLSHPRASDEIEAMCVRLLELALHHGLSDRESSPRISPKNLHLARAREYIEGHLADAPTLGDITRAAGTSTSSLLRAFKRELGATPVRYLKERRLETARRDLLLANPETGSVSEVAYRYGFHQLGRFAGDFKRAFGELPSDTLKRFSRE